MRKAFVLCLILFLFETVVAQPQTELQVQNRNPIFPAPGDTVELNLLVSNEGTSEKAYRPLEVETVKGIDYRGTTSGFGEAFSLCGGCQTTGTLYFQVSKDAQSGAYPIDIKATGNNGIGIVEKTEVDVDGSPNLILETDTEVTQGNTSISEIKIENVGTEKASDLSVNLEHPLIAFQPSKIFFGNLEVGESRNASVEIKVDDNLGSGPESIDALIEHREGSVRAVENSSVNLDVLKNVDLAISHIESSAEIGSSSRVMVELENVGDSEAERISTDLNCQNEVVSKGQDFVGSLDAGESLPTVYSVTPKSESTDCTLNADYTGESRETLEESFELNAEASVNYPVYVSGILVIIGGLIYVRSYAKGD
jgi:hypothetical protein